MDKHAIQLVGCGSFSSVYRIGDSKLVEKHINLQKIVKKKYPKRPISKDAQQYKQRLIELIDQEIRALRQLKHRNIVNLYDVKIPLEPKRLHNQSEADYILKFEYCDQGDLHKALKTPTTFQEYRTPEGGFNVCFTIHVLEQLLDGLEYIHDQGYVHRDIKTGNVLLKTRPHAPKELPLVKIADLGFATRIQQDNLDQLNTICGTVGYMAPEVVSRHIFKEPKRDLSFTTILPYTLSQPTNTLPIPTEPQSKQLPSLSFQQQIQSRDVWSCGVILYELMTNTLPIILKHDSDSLVNQIDIIALTAHIPIELRDLILGMMTIDMTIRLTVKETKQQFIEQCDQDSWTDIRETDTDPDSIGEMMVEQLTTPTLQSRLTGLLSYFW